MNEPRVYKTSPILLVFIAILFLFFLGILLFAFGPGSLAFMIPLAVLSFFLFGAAFVALASKTIVSDDEIAIQGLFGTKNLKWTEIARASGWGYSMKLHSRDEDVTVAVSPRMPGYQEVIEFVGSKRPDLFSPREYGEMRRGVGSLLGMFFIILIMVGVSIAFIFVTMESSDTSFSAYLPLLIFVGVVLFLAASVLSTPRSVTLDGNMMTLKYFFSEKIIRTDEVNSIQLSYTQSRNGRHYFIALNLINRKSIRISGLGISLPIAYLVLKNWRMNNTQGRPSNNIAPNWSDNTWR
ncbi:MAG: hypothetical protein HYU84_16020 [Chloroflexi bacterium]|nr:hypothetical protein [Chloroflexota bacterium]MBI3168755.1 hypothetical protein [Chloroflexota bacterium]